MDEFADAGCM